MKAKIHTPKSRAVYSPRLGSIEPVIGHITAHMCMDCPTLCDRAKVNIQWKLYCLVHNFEKIARYGAMNN